MGLIVEKTDECTLTASSQQAALFARHRAARPSFVGNKEPLLGEILTDPILHRLLASDGIRADHLIDLIADMKVKLARRR